jgi:glycosyltransferase involved in cell wall biosynthesis
MRGGERVLHEFALMYPEADLYTLIHVPGSTSPEIENRTIFTSFLNRLPGGARNYKKLLPLFPRAARSLRLDGYDLVLSSSHAVAKGVRIAAGTPHVCYIHTPMRYIWDHVDTYLGRGLKRALATPLIHYLRRFDVKTSGPAQVTRYVANSTTVAERVQRHYGRDAAVIHPPVDTGAIRPSGAPPEEFYFVLGGFVPYKQESLAVEAFRLLDRTLVVAGDGPSRAAVQAAAPPNVQFRGRVSDDELADLYARCRALIYPQEEDFGIIAVEAQAAGRPVIAYGVGGATDTVRPWRRRDAAAPTGVWFDAQTPEALADAVRKFEEHADTFDAAAIRSWAEGFGRERFREEMRAEIERTLAAHAAA